MVIDHIHKLMNTEPLKIWTTKEIIRELPFPPATIRAAMCEAAKQHVAAIERVGHGKYRFRLEGLMPWVIDGDPEFVYTVDYTYGRVDNPQEGVMMIKARNVIEAGLKVNSILRAEISNPHITSVTQED